MAEWDTDEELLEKLREATGHARRDALVQQLQALVAGDYEVLETIGEGACGVVFKARDVHLDRMVAIKCPGNPSQQRRLAAIFDEARLMAKINHPNIVAIYSLSERSSPPFMVMEFVDGVRIDHAAAELPLEQKVALFRQLLRGVAELHHRGIVHRDLKPSNILVDNLGRVKVLDMGIAEQLPAEGQSFHAPSSVRGTPAYMAPEQSAGVAPQPTEDVFALGIILFELLTGQHPFGGSTVEEVLRSIRQDNPPLPRALRSEIPGPLQAICLTALEKDPAKRYPSARHFLLDLERFLDGEAVTANPTLLADVLEDGIDRHLRDLDRWQQDRLISAREYDYFVDRYRRLRRREEFWILDSRRITFSQVLLHLGAWSCVVAAFLMRCFSWRHLADWERVALPLVVFLILIGTGLFLWNRRTKRVAVVLLMAGALTWPLLVATTFAATAWLSNVELSDNLLPQGFLNNFQLFLAAGTSTVLSLMLWRLTRTGAFSLITVLSFMVLATAAFAVLGMRGLIETGDLDTIAAWYLGPGLLSFAVGMVIDLRHRQPYLAGPFYVVGVLVLLASATIIALKGPTTKWVGLGDVAHGVEYSFMANGLLYLGLGWLADRSVRSFWLRRIAMFLFWLTPSHVLVPMLLLEVDGAWAILPGNWTLPQLLLPLGATCFIFASVPKQMKSFFFSGLFYVGVGVQRLTARHFEDVLAWPIALTVVGLLLAVLAWRRPGLFDTPRASKEASSTGTSRSARLRQGGRRTGVGER